MKRLLAAFATIVALAGAGAAFAQDATPADSTVVPDSTTAAPAKPVRAARASWLSDRTALRPGDLVTVLVDEQTEARERTQHVATGTRSQRADLNAGIGTDLRVGPGKSFGSSLNNNTREVGDAGHSADFTTVITCRVLDVSPNGVARISGTKKTSVDGRVQDVTLTGAIRAEDVNVRNQVRSDAIVDAVITYKGKKIAPRNGLLGKLLGALWP
ncbi:MAG: flagellar basal body L-ring protein FlgH [Burkholderiaceae bacterium]